jgi:hypothetical protein
MADVDINKRLVFIKDTTKQVSLPPNTATPGSPITPAVEVDFLSLTDTPDSYDGKAEAFAIVNADEDGIELKKVSEFDTKATPIAADKIAIIDSEDGDLLKVVEIGDLPGGGGGDTVEGNEDRGIEVTEPTPGTKVVNQKYKNTFITVGASVAITLSEGRRHILSVANDFGLLNPTNIADYEGPVEIIITQGLGGDHQISTVGDKIIFPNNVIPTLSGVFGESDWLRGIAANGYLLIYQIENLAAPDIDVPPPPPPPIPVSNYLGLFSFFQLNDSLANAGDYERDQDGIDDDLIFNQQQVSAQNIYNHLKASSPISSWGGLRVLNQFWRDQSGNAGANAVITSATSTYPIGIKNGGGFYKTITSSGTLSLISSVWASKPALTFTFLFDLRNPLSDLFIRLNTSVLMQLGLVSSSDFRLRLFIRRVGADALTTIDDAVNAPIGQFILQVVANYAAGTVHFYKNNTLIGTDNLASSGNFATGVQTLELLQNFGTNLIGLKYFSLRDGANLTDAATERAFVDALHGGIITLPLKVGGACIELFDFIINLDRYNYSPYAANVRESGGNTELVISHDNTTGLFDVTAFNTHIGANNGFASRMINQQLPSQALTQTTAARQFEILPNEFGNRAALNGSFSARRSLQMSIPINTNALIYTYFFITKINATPTTRQLLSSTVGSGNTTRMFCEIVNSSTNIRMQMVQRRVNADADRIATGATNLAINTAYLFTYQFDYQNGIMRSWVNGVQEINDTSAYSGTTIGSATLVCVGNYIDNSTVPYNGKLGFGGLVQGAMTTAQREAIEAYLMDTYGI